MSASSRRAVVIGAGYAGLSAAACLAQAGFSVTILEKNNQAGGRARMFEAQGFRFDMGPSWYWMPDVFENFFRQFGKSPADYYTLQQLDPSYAVFFGPGHVAHLPAQPEARMQLFESYEKGAGAQLAQFLKEAAYKYRVGMQDLVYKPGKSIAELADWRILRGLFRLHLFQSFHRHIRKHFRDPQLLQLLEFPVLFLGATPRNTPALYSLMNYADIALGTWYPQGGMHEPIQAMVRLNAELGTQIITQAEVKALEVAQGNVQGVVTDQQTFRADVVVANGDYHHVDQRLLPAPYRSYSAAYWDRRVLAPSCLLYYLGVSKRLNKLLHHNLFFHTSMQQHFHEIYEAPQWPTNPLFYVSCPSQTDPTVAPAGCENVFILIPVAPDMRDTPDIRQQYLQQTLTSLEQLTGQTIRDHITYQRSYAYQDFVQDYHAFKGNAYGLASTLFQTAIFRPSLRSKKVRNLYYTGQFTVPGPGVPPSIISGQVVAKEIIRSRG